MLNRTLKLSPLLAVLVLGACATIPPGPRVVALPGTGKSFEDFKASDYECRQYAESQTGMNPNDAAANSAVSGAIVGTAVGALAGAMIGGHGGAGVGAGMGLATGAIAGAGAGGASGRNFQHRYDASYQQCMYARGHKVPVSGRMESPRPMAARPVYGPPPGYYPPPPPPNYGQQQPQSNSGGYYPPPPPQGVSPYRQDRQ